MMNIETKKIFQYDAKDPIIACVGSNGGTYDINIFNGYNEAVRIIYENIKYYEDILVYPLVFDMRHVIELGMKIYIRLIMDIPTFNEFRRNNLNNINITSVLDQHDISNLFKVFIATSNFNRELKYYIKQNRNTLNEIKAFTFDKRADMFRYAKSKSSIFNLKSVRISHIPISKLYKSYSQIYDALSKIIYLCYCILKEYELGAYTTNLSRQDLIEIAKIISIDFKINNFVSKKIKKRVKKIYHISNSEFDEAVSIIKKHRYMSSILGKEIKFKYNKDNVNAIIIYCDFIKKYGVSLPNKPTLASKLPDADTPFKKMTKLLDNNQLKFLSTFVYLSKMDYYNVENINKIYNDFKNYIDIRSFALQLVYKNTFDHLINGLILAGQTSYLKLVQRL